MSKTITLLCVTYLNTSYVKVKLSWITLNSVMCIYLNTSYVKVKQIIILIFVKQFSDLNTSYVKVKLTEYIDKWIAKKKFKYILC